MVSTIFGLSVGGASSGFIMLNNDFLLRKLFRPFSLSPRNMPSLANMDDKNINHQWLSHLNNCRTSEFKTCFPITSIFINILWRARLSMYIVL